MREHGPFVAVLLAAFVFPARKTSALALFVGFMATSSFRMVPMQALSSRVPENTERAGFMSWIVRADCANR
jgi:hypothetical protein